MTKIKEVRRYSEAFKRQVVNELARGKFSSQKAAMEAYGIKGGVRYITGSESMAMMDYYPN